MIKKEAQSRSVNNIDEVAQGVPLTEYAIFIVMIIFITGFAWLWRVEKARRRKDARSKEIER